MMMKSIGAEQALPPAFSNTIQLCGFILFIACILLFPFLPKDEIIDRGKLYLNIQHPEWHGLEYFSKQIWPYSGEIDILFIGHSGVGAAIIPNILIEKLTPLTTKKPAIFIVEHDGDRIDIEYMILKDLLAHKKIKLIIWQLNSFPPRFPEEWTEGLWDFHLHKEILSNLTQENFTQRYWQTVFSTLKNINSQLRPLNMLVSKDCMKFDNNNDNKCNIEMKHYGARLRDYNSTFQPQLTSSIPLSDIVHVRSKSEDLQYSQELPLIQQQMINSVIRDASQHNTAIAFMQVPYELNKKPPNKITIPQIKTSDLGAEIPIIAISSEKLFEGLDDNAISKYYTEDDNIHTRLWHLNAKAAVDFTKIISPAIIFLYKKLVLKEPIDLNQDQNELSPS